MLETAMAFRPQETSVDGVQLARGRNVHPGPRGVKPIPWATWFGEKSSWRRTPGETVPGSSSKNTVHMKLRTLGTWFDMRGIWVALFLESST